MSSSLYQGIGTTPQQLTTTSQQLQGYVTSAEQAATNAGTSRDAAETALDLFDDRFLGAKNSDPTLDNDGNALVDGAMYFDSTLNVMKVYDLAGTAWLQLNLSSSQQASVNTLVSVITPTNHIAALGPVTNEIATVAGQISPTNNLVAVAGDATNIGLVAGVSTDVATVAGQISPTNNIATVAGRDADIGTVAARDLNIGTVAGRDADIGTVAARDSNIGTLASISGDITSLANALGATTTYVVTVAGGVYYIDGVSNPTLTFTSGNTYIFDLSDSTNTGHPLAFKDGSGTSYTTGVTTTGTAGSTGAQVQIDVASNAPSSLRYYCTVHGNGMGNTISVVNSNLSLVASNITSVNTVANSTNLANITAVAGDATDIGNVAANITGTDTIGTVANATNLANITTVANATNLANINTLANSTNLANITTLANSDNLSAINGFAARYRVDTADPTTSLDAGDLFYNTTSNTLKRYNGTGWISIASGLTDVVADTSPSLGGSLDVNGNSIVSTSNGNISITPDGTGKVVIDGLSHPTADGTSGQFLKTDGSGNLSFDTLTTDLSGDSSPQLGGNLDVVTHSIVSTSNRDITINPNGTGNVLLGNYEFDADQSVGSGQDNYVLTYDNSTGHISLEVAAAGGGATGGGSDEIFYENGQNVTTNYTITNGKNAMSAGPITIDSGVTVTVGSGETWTVV